MSSAASAPIPVVCAVLWDAVGRVLVAQRPPHKHLGLKWEFPGGKVEANETPEAALVREMREELGCEVTVTRRLSSFVHDYGTVRIEMIPLICELQRASPALHPHEHVAVRWVTIAELAGLDLAPADWPVVGQLGAK